MFRPIALSSFFVSISLSLASCGFVASAPTTSAPTSPLADVPQTSAPTASDSKASPTAQQLPADAPPEALALIRQWQTLNTQCRGGRGDDPQTQQACDAREKLYKEIAAKGWCYGRPGESGYQYQWHRCTSAVKSSSAQSAPNLIPVRPDVCQSARFYQVKTTGDLPLPAYGDRQLKTSVTAIASGTTIIDTAGGFLSYLVPGRKELVYLDANDVKRSLVKLQFASEFSGKMRVKTLDQGAFLNIRKQPTLSGSDQELIVGTVADGVEVKVLGLNANDVPYFAYIVTPKGVEGYIDRTYLVCS